MKKIRINAREIVRDIKERVDLNILMEKHGLSYRHLLKANEVLLERGWVTRAELCYLNLTDATAQKTVLAKEFLASFRNRPDDFQLMGKFRLTAKDLKKIYETLIQTGLLSEYEYHCRDRKAPELEQPPINSCEASTEVTLISNAFDGALGVYRAEEGALPKGSDPDVTRAGKSSSTRRPKEPSMPSVNSGNNMREETTPEVCPNCGCPSQAFSPDACVSCGIVFSKVKRVPKNKRISLWQFDYGIR
ncbi:MAG: hypothetical protein ACLP5H_22360 [Desulfomonilaceae bacterium]